MDLKTYIAEERGRSASLAARLGVSASYLSQMVSGLSPVSPERCVEIEKSTNGVVTRQDLRPRDWRLIWPELDAAHPMADADPIESRRGREFPSVKNIL